MRAGVTVLLVFLLHATGSVRPDTPPSDWITTKLAEMTLAEKLGQLTQQPGGLDYNDNPGVQKQRLDELLGHIRSGQVGALLGAHGAEYTNTLQRAAVEQSRHKLPLLLGNDVIHGYRTIFPIPLGEAATWNPELIEQACAVAAREARAAGTHWTFAPMVDVCRDPRWGRIAETAGEDPYLGSVIAAARVRGFQGVTGHAARPSQNSLSNGTAAALHCSQSSGTQSSQSSGIQISRDRVLASAKHFVAYGAAESGRDYNTVDLSLQTLHEIHLPTFRAAVQAGAGSIMTSFNEINGVPASANPYTLEKVLRGDWGFAGFVVSDWSSITEMVAHGFATDDADAALKAMRCGVDIDMSSTAYRTHLASAVESGLLPESVIDTAVRRTLVARERLGLFKNPYSDPAEEARVSLCAEHRALAREVARQSLVLLKNENNLLPLDKARRRIAVIGPLADSRRDPLGTWAGIGKPEDVVTVLEGLKQAAGDGEILHAAGSAVQQPIDGGIERAVQVARDSDLTIMVLGESEDMSGEALCRASIELPQPQLDLLKAVHAVGKPIIVVLLHGRPLAIPWLAEHVPAIVLAWHPGIECGHAIADVLFGHANPSGKLPATFPRSTGQIPLYYNHKNTGRPPKADERFTSKYIDVPWTPQYPFGHGLSYTQFEFARLRATPERVAPDETVTISVEVRNAGERAGDEVVQVYFRDPVASMTRPVRQLCGFQKVSLASGESKLVSIEVPAERFGFYDSAMRFVVEPGEIQLFVGGSSIGGLEARVQITGRD